MRLGALVYPPINPVKIFGDNLRRAVSRVMDCFLGLLLWPLFKA